MVETETSKQETSVRFTPFPEDVQDQIKQDFPAYEDGLVQSDPGRVVAFPRLMKHFQQLQQFSVRPDDCWVVTFPKCGTTWMQELVWLVVNNCNFEGAQTLLDIRSPFLEIPFLLPERARNEVPEDDLKSIGMFRLDDLDAMPSPRVIKSHFPLSLLPRKTLDMCKIVYVARNPKDAIVSYYYHHQLFPYTSLKGDLQTFTEYFMKDQVLYAPYFPHVLEAWNHRNHRNVLFVFYEDLKRDFRGQIEKITRFLNKPLTDDQMTRLTQHLSFENFAKNEAVNKEQYKGFGFMNKNGHFIRKGITGDWKNQFGPELNAKIDQWIEKNLEGTDLKFITELDQQD